MSITTVSFQATCVFLLIYVTVTYLSWLQILLFLYALHVVYMSWTFTCYTRQGIPCAGTRIPGVGSTVMLDTFTKGMVAAQAGLLEKHGKTFHEFWGRFPILTTVDPDIIREVFVKQFRTFPTRPSIPSTDETIESMLNVVRDYDHWKYLRSLLSPTLSTGKIRMMMSQINNCARQLVSHLHKAPQDKSIDIKEYVGAFTLDIIASTAFGFELDTMNDRNSMFVRMAKKAFQFSFLSPAFLIIIFFPPLYPLAIRLANPLMDKEAVSFFKDIVQQAMENRNEQEAADKVDFLQLMINAHNAAESAENEETQTPKQSEQQLVEKKQPKRKLTTTEILANGIVFFIAGYETTATSISFLAQNLALNREVQDKLIEEIDRVCSRGGGTAAGHWSVSDKELHEMPYLDMCVNESLRLFPPGFVLDRQAGSDVEIKGIKIPQYTSVRVPVFHMHRLAEYYPEPEKFIPERFSPEEKAKRDPLVYLPFGMGPRNCIAMRLALLEIKVAIVSILKEFYIMPSPEARNPIKLVKVPPFAPEGGHMIKLQSRNADKAD